MDERRERPRIRAAGTATVERSTGERAEFAIRDISAKGARLVGELPLFDGEPVRVAIAIEGLAVALAAVVTRTDSQNAQVAIEFQGVAAAVSERIECAVELMIARVRESAPACVLVSHPDPEIRAALERDLSRLDLAATSDVTGQLTAALAGETGALALFQRLAAQHPRVKRILVFDGPLGRVDHALSSLVQAVLRTPWRIRALSRALGIDATDSSLALLPAQDHEP